MNAFFSFDLFIVYIPECKQQLKTMKSYTQIRDNAHFKSLAVVLLLPESHAIMNDHDVFMLQIIYTTIFRVTV